MAATVCIGHECDLDGGRVRQYPIEYKYRSVNHTDCSESQGGLFSGRQFSQSKGETNAQARHMMTIDNTVICRSWPQVSDNYRMSLCSISS